MILETQTTGGDTTTTTTTIMVSVVVHDSNHSSQYLLSLLAPVSVAPVAPVFVIHGTSIDFVVCSSSLQYWLCCSCLQYLSLVVAPVLSAVVCGSSLQYLSFMAPVVSVSPVVHGSGSICISCRSWLQPPVSVGRLWLQYQSFVFPVPLLSTIICCRSIGWLLLVAPVALVVVVAPVAPVVSSVVACGSSIGGFVLVHGSRLLYLLMLRYLSFVAPVVAPACRHGSCGSSICCGCLQYHYLLLVAPVAPVSVACGCCCSCCFNRQSSSVLAIFLQNSVLLLYLSKYRQITTTEW